MMRKKNFTLIEMLVVVALIAILAGIGFPAISSFKRKGQETEAAADCKAIATAMAKAKATYGKMADSTQHTDGVISNVDAYIKELSCPNDVTVTFNTRKIVFLDPKPNGENWRDPWGEKYIILFDQDYDNKVTVNGETLHGSVFVYSKGLDKKEDKGKKNDEGNNKDNPKSWK